MADILSTIRTNLAEETVRVAMGTEQASQASEAVPDDDDVLELSNTDLVTNLVAAPVAPAEPLVPMPEAQVAVPSLLDELNEQVLDEALAAPAAKPDTASAATDDFDRLLKEISTNQADQADQVQEQRAALLAEDDDLSDVLSASAPVENAPAETTQAADKAMYQASAVQVAGGDMQVALPAEVLAMALRPLVQEWLKANLPAVVERLVQAEIAKLSGN
jgi:cell pole-organizing protein PopZ